MTTSRLLKPTCLSLAMFFSVGLSSISLAMDDNQPISVIADLAEKQQWRELDERLGQDSIDRVAVNSVQADGMTALHWAVWHDKQEAADRLIKAGADVAVRTQYGVTPLSIACTNGDAEMVRLLLKAGAKPNDVLRGDETPLMAASRAGSAEAVQLLIEGGAEINARERKGQTALMWAAAEGHADVVDQLIQAGADWKLELSSGFDAFAFAVREGKPEVVRLLIKHGADPNKVFVKKGNGKAPRVGSSPLILAVENGHFELAIELVKAGADPNDQRTGYTPLHTLTWVRKPNRGDGDDGEAAPDGSGKLTSLQFVRELVSLGADVNRKLEKGSGGKGVLNRQGATPFFMACMTDDLPLIQLLLELGADPKTCNVDGSTPLMAACGLGALAPEETAGTEDEAIEVVPVLLGLGLDVNAVDKNGETAMHGAAYKNAPKLIHLLVDRGADRSIWNRDNKYGWTPLEIAQGYRPGNFKPSQATIDAIEQVLNRN